MMCVPARRMRSSFHRPSSLGSASPPACPVGATTNPSIDAVMIKTTFLMSLPLSFQLDRDRSVVRANAVAHVRHAGGVDDADELELDVVVPEVVEEPPSLA